MATRLMFRSFKHKKRKVSIVHYLNVYFLCPCMYIFSIIIQIQNNKNSQDNDLNHLWRPTLIYWPCIDILIIFS